MSSALTKQRMHAIDSEKKRVTAEYEFSTGVIPMHFHWNVPNYLIFHWWTQGEPRQQREFRVTE